MIYPTYIEKYGLGGVYQLVRPERCERVRTKGYPGREGGAAARRGPWGRLGGYRGSGEFFRGNHDTDGAALCSDIVDERRPEQTGPKDPARGHIIFPGIPIHKVGLVQAPLTDMKQCATVVRAVISCNPRTP